MGDHDRVMDRLATLLRELTDAKTHGEVLDCAERAAKELLSAEIAGSDWRTYDDDAEHAPPEDRGALEERRFWRGFLTTMPAGPRVVADLTRDVSGLAPVARDAGVRSALGVSVGLRRRSLALGCAWSRPHESGAEEQRLLEMIANAAWSAADRVAWRIAAERAHEQALAASPEPFKRLVGFTAFDLINALTVNLSCADELRHVLANDAANIELADMIDQASQRAMRLAQSLYTARGSFPDPHDPQTRRSVLEETARRELRGDETILLVGEFLTKHDYQARLLRERGFRVLEAFDSEEALAKFERSPETIDLLIASSSIRSWSELDLAQRLMRSRPKMRAIITVEGEELGQTFPSNVLAIERPWIHGQLHVAIRQQLAARG